MALSRDPRREAIETPRFLEIQSGEYQIFLSLHIFYLFQDNYHQILIQLEEEYRMIVAKVLPNYI
jgi:hypothetical protein